MRRDERLGDFLLLPVVLMRTANSPGLDFCLEMNNYLVKDEFLFNIDERDRFGHMKITFGFLCGVGALCVGIIALYVVNGRAVSSVSEQSNVIIVGTNANFPPFEYMLDGKLVGFDIDLMEALAERMHKKIEWRDIAFTSLLLETQSGQIHAIASAMTPTVERAEQLSFLPAYLEQDPLQVITRRGLVAPQSLADLMGKEVIVNDGYTAESFMAQQTGVSLKRVTSIAEAFLALNAGRGDAFVSARSATQSFFNCAGVERYNVLALEQHETYAVAVSKIYPDLYRAMSVAYGQLVDDGTLSALKEKWHLMWR